MNRKYRILQSAAISIVIMALLAIVTPTENAPRILVLLGGSMPEGIIQGVTYFLFIYGMLEIWAIKKYIEKETASFQKHFLPEQENWVLDAEEANKIKLDMQQIEQQEKYLLVDLIKKACTKYRLSKSSSEVLGLVDSQIRLYGEQMESEQAFIRYTSWAIPSVGFIGTVLGIAASLGFANEASTPEGIEKVTSMLAVAFDTTLVALVLSVVLMYCIHYIQKEQDTLFTKMNSYMIENLVNRLYK